MDTSHVQAGVGWRQRLADFVLSAPIQRAILAIILLNAIVLGLQTSQSAMAVAGTWLELLDQICFTIFVIEIGAKIIGLGSRFHRDPWNLFDAVVIGIALVPASGPFAVLRALRVLRVLRVVSVSPAIRRVAQGLLAALPGMGAIVSLLGIWFYVAAVIATQLFGNQFPDWFGSLGATLYTLFQVMTLESWSMGIVRPVMEEFPYAWMFFIPFILIATFMMLNLFIGVIVNAIQNEVAHEAEEKAEQEGVTAAHLLAEIRALRTEVEELRAGLRQDR
jgi:voltage-gated sodium channel